jgi:hypothetical protein
LTIGGSVPDAFSNPYKYAATVVGIDTAEAFFRPNILASGYYDVLLWYSEQVNRSTNAPVTEIYQGGSVSSNFDETVPGGKWELISPGQYFGAGTNGCLRLGNGTGETNKVVIADAVEWTYSIGQDSPGNGTVPGWWSDYYFGTNSVTGADKGSNGYSLFANYVMGLVPTNPVSIFSFSITANSNGLNATFSPLLNGRSYQLQSTTDLFGLHWLTLSNLTVNSSTNSRGTILAATPHNSATFYRLAVALTP